MLMAAPKAAPTNILKPVSEDSMEMKLPWSTEKRPRDGRSNNGGHRSRKYALDDDANQEPSDKPVKKRRKTKIKEINSDELSESAKNKDSSPMKRWRVKTVVDTHIEIMRALSASTINT